MEKKDNLVELYCVKVLKDDKRYYDFVLIWRHNDKVYDLRIEPTFYDRNDLKCLLGKSIICETVEEFRELVKKDEIKL